VFWEIISLHTWKVKEEKHQLVGI